MKLKPTNDLALAIYRQDLPSFVERAFEELNPSTKFKANWHHSAMAALLDQVGKGEERRAIINVCPRSAKSTFVSVAWAAYEIGHDPALSILVVSHNKVLADQLSHAFRKLVNSTWYKQVFPNMKGKPETDNETTYRTSAGGGRMAVSVESGVTGLGADIIIIDDPIDTDKALNPNACDATNEWIAGTLMTRLNDKSTGRVVLVMQRVSIYDTTAFLLDKEPWKQLSLPAKTDVDRTVKLFDGDSYYWKQGDLLHEAFLSQAVYDAQRNYLGDAAFSAQYLQRPLPYGGGHIDLSKFKRWTELPPPGGLTLMSVDAASGMNEGSRSAIQIWRLVDGKLYLVGLNAGHWPFPRLRDGVLRNMKRFNIDTVIVEHASSGIALLEDLHRHFGPIEYSKRFCPQHPKVSKEDRMAKAMIMVEQGKVFLPSQESEQLASLERELVSFPAGKYDDQVDALSQVINWARNYNAGPPLLGSKVTVYELG